MNFSRRDVLELLAISATAAVADALTGCAHSTASAALRGNAPMTTRHLLTLKLAVAPTHVIGNVAVGRRVVFPITGGEFEGPRLRGKVLPGGDDWTLLRPDQVLELDERITLQTDDGELIYLSFTGLRHGSPEYFRTAARFETASEKYAFLNKLLAIGSGETRPSGPVHVIEELL